MNRAISYKQQNMDVFSVDTSAPWVGYQFGLVGRGYGVSVSTRTGWMGYLRTPAEHGWVICGLQQDMDGLSMDSSRVWMGYLCTPAENG